MYSRGYRAAALGIINFTNESSRSTRARTPRATPLPTAHEHYTSRPAECVRSVNHSHAEEKMHDCRACEPKFEEYRIRRQFFIDIYGFIVIASRTDAQMWRSGDFPAYDNNDNDRHSNYFTPCACAQGNTMIIVRGNIILGHRIHCSSCRYRLHRTIASYSYTIKVEQRPNS